MGGSPGEASRGAEATGGEQPTVGQRVRALRERLGMTQAELAGDRYSAAYISTVETERRTASRELLEYLAPRLGVEVAELSGNRAAAWAVELARDLRSQGRSRAARELLERSLTNLEHAGRVAPTVLVLMHRELARSSAGHDLGRAEKYLQRALQFAQKEGVARSDLAVTYVELGDVQSRRGHHRAATGAYREAARLMLELFGNPLNGDDASGTEQE